MSLHIISTIFEHFYEDAKGRDGHGHAPELKKTFVSKFDNNLKENFLRILFFYRNNKKSYFCVTQLEFKLILFIHFT